jgi:hypothetical protein
VDRSLYEILELPPGAGEGEVKAAFRRLALVRHPDHIGNTPETQTAFVVLLDAYRTLSDPGRKRDYDHYLATRPVRTAPGRQPPPREAPPAFDNRLNSLLWDLEDLVVRSGHARVPCGWDRKAAEAALEDLLGFWDRWILVPAGFPDYFFEARRMAPTPPVAGGHRPFTSVENHFFDVRKRMNRALGVLDRRDLTVPLPGTGVPWVEVLLEAQARAVHTIGALERMWDGSARTVPPYPGPTPSCGSFP